MLFSSNARDKVNIYCSNYVNSIKKADIFDVSYVSDVSNLAFVEEYFDKIRQNGQF